MTDTDTQKLAADDAAWEAWPCSDDYAERDAFRSGYLAALNQQVSASDARLREAVDRGARAVIAYHVAICSPKGVVPDDSFYDPVIAERCEREMELARTAIRAALPIKEKTDV